MSWTLPTNRPITQPWGAEFDDWDGDGVTDYPGGFYHSIGWDGHNGIDYGCFTGDPVDSVADGVVEFAGWGDNDRLMSGGGNAIRIRHEQAGVRSGYLHLSDIYVTPGQTVTAGQTIGAAGATGAATAAHLHLEFFPLNEPNQGDRWRGRIDPTPYLYAEQDSYLSALSDQDQQNIYHAQGRIDAGVAELITVARAIAAKLGAPLPTTTLVKGTDKPAVYAWDGGDGYRELDYPEFVALIQTGATLRTVDQGVIDKAVS